MNKRIIILLSVLFIGAFFRFYQLQSAPPSASLDEVSIGWNAYSILETGKDEYGSKFPILLRAYDDYRPALYVYFVIPFIKIFDLNVLAVRLPSVILSVFTIFITYLLVKELLKKQKILNTEHVALICAFILAISPWHIYISRLGHEVNLGLFLVILAILFFFKNKIYLSALFFILSFISYQTEKIFIPVLILGMIFIFRNDLLKIRKKIAMVFIFSLIILTPFIKSTFSEDALIRFSGTNVFKHSEHRFIEQSKKLQRSVEQGDIIGQIVHNRRILSAQILAEGYLSHFDPSWLFTNASGDKHKIPNLGLLYIWEIPFILVGIYVLLRHDFDPRLKRFIFLWFLSAPIAASLTTDAPHALRSFVFLPTWQIFSSVGLIFVFSQLKSNTIKKTSLIFSMLIILFSIFYLSKNYFDLFPKTQSASFQYSISKAIPNALEIEDSYEKIIFSNSNKLYQSYMFFLFYSKYDPKLYQEHGGTDSGGYSKEHKFGKYEFRQVDALKEKKGKNYLYVTNYQDVLEEGKIIQGVKPVKVIKRLTGENSIILFIK